MNSLRSSMRKKLKMRIRPPVSNRKEDRSDVQAVVELAERAIDASENAAAAHDSAKTWHHKFQTLQADMREFAKSLPSELKDRFIALIDNR